MRFSVLLPALCLLVAPALQAQSIEATVWLPDSLSGVADLGAAAYSPASNRVYIGGRLGGRVAVVDAATRQKLCNIEVGGQIGRNFATDCMVYVPGLDRVLCAVGTTDSMVTIDCATNTVVGRFAAGSEPGELLYNAARDRVYCASKGGNSVLVINPATSTVERSIAVDQRPGAMTLNVPNNRLYVHCAYGGSIAVIDCDIDSVITVLPYNTGGFAHPTANRVYLGLLRKIGVLDAVTNQLIDSIPIPENASGFAHSPTDNRLYVASYSADSLYVFDCTTNGRVAAFHLYRPFLLHYNGQDNKVYCACNDGTVAVIDCVSNSIVATIPRWGSAMVRNTVNDQVWLLDRQRNDVTVVDGTNNGILGSVVVGSEPSLLCYNPQRDKLYCADQLGGRVYVIDARWLGTARMIPVTGNPAGLVYNPALDRIYCSGYAEQGGSVHVIDCATDSLIASVPTGHPTGPNGLGCSPVGNKVYAANGDQTVTVIDCATNQVVNTIPIGCTAFGPFCYNSVDDKLYLATGYDTLLTIIDCAGDSVRRQLAIPEGPVMCYCPDDNALYVAHVGAMSGVAEKIDGAADTVIRSASLLDNTPSGICCNPEDGLLYVAMDFMNWVEVVDLAHSHVADTVPVGNGPGRLLYNSINNKVYCANARLTVNGGGTVSVIDCSTHTVTTTIRVGDEPVDLAWYEARNRVFTANHGGSSVSVLLDAGGAVAETPSAEVRMTNAATVVRGVLWQTAYGTQHTAYRAELLDAAGRKVMELRAGANDVSRLAPGVYFVRQAQAQAQPRAIRKVIVRR